MVIGLKRVVLDVLKPLEAPTLPDLAKSLSKLEGVSGVNISLLEIDKQTENIKITVEGENINYKALTEHLDRYGVVIHSIDEVAAGKRMVESVETPQD